MGADAAGSSGSGTAVAGEYTLQTAERPTHEVRRVANALNEVWRNHASVNSIGRPTSTHGVTLQGGRGGQFCPPQAMGSEPA